MALYECSWRWHPSTVERPPADRAADFRRVFTAAETAEPFGERLRGWYSYPGAAQAGFLLVEAASHEELARLLQPYTELMGFDVKPIVSVDYQQRRKQI